MGWPVMKGDPSLVPMRLLSARRTRAFLVTRASNGPLASAGMGAETVKGFPLLRVVKWRFLPLMKKVQPAEEPPCAAITPWAGSFSSWAVTVKGRLATAGDVSWVKVSPIFGLKDSLGEALAFLFLFQDPKGTTPRSLAHCSYWAAMVLRRSGCLSARLCCSVRSAGML